MKLRAPMPELYGATTWLNREVKREELIGDKPTLIHFWSVSCYLCKEEMPSIQNLIQRYKDSLNILSVHMPLKKEDMELTKVKEVASRFYMKQPIYVDHSLYLTNYFNNQYVPSYYLFDKTGILRHYQTGGTGMRMLEQRILRLLNE